MAKKLRQKIASSGGKVIHFPNAPDVAINRKEIFNQNKL